MLAIGKWLSIVVVGAWSGREEEDRIMVFFYGGRWFYDDGGQHTGEKEVGCW